MGKGEIAHYEQFLLFHVFKSCLLLMRQNEYLGSKGLSMKHVFERLENIVERENKRAKMALDH